MNKTLLLEQLKKVPYISKQNLGLILEKEDENLNYWVKKLISDKTLIPLKKGLYISRYYYDIISEIGPFERENYLIYLANSIRQPSYVSLEYVLSKGGLLPESSFSITSITLKSTREYVTDIGTFYYKNIKREFFYGYKIKQFKDKQIREASIAKALFDFFYLRTFKSEAEIQEFITVSGRFNWDILNKSDKRQLADFIITAQSKKMQKLLSILQKEKII